MTSLTELKRPETLPAATARHIGDAIVSGVYAEGDALPETALAKELSVSRGTVREALRLLADDGLVSIIPHRGACVAPMSARVVHETFRLRALLESFAARLAVEGGHINEAMGTLEDAYLEVERWASMDSVSSYVAADREFHNTISRLSNDSSLLEVLETLQPRVRRFIIWGRSNVPLADWATHADIMAALRAGDPELAARAVRNHIVPAGDALVASIELREGGDRDR